MDIKKGKVLIGFVALVALFTIPFAVGQTYGPEINAILDAYFNNQQIEQDAPVSSDKKLIGVDILTEEEWRLKNRQLDVILSQASTSTAKLKALRAESAAYITQLQTLDAEISVRDDALGKIIAQKTQWQAQQAKRAEERQILDRIIKNYTSELEDLVRGEFMTAEKLTLSPDWTAISWVLGDKTASVLQEERFADKTLARARAEALRQTQNAEKQIEKEETLASIYVSRLADLESKISREEEAMYELAKEKATTLALVDKERTTLQDQNETLTGQIARIEESIDTQIENEESLRAQNLNPLYAISVEEEIDLYGFFASPVDGEIEITAGFRDPEHEKVINQPHYAVDIKIPQESPIYAMADGIVRSVGVNADDYAFVVIEHAGGWRTVYGHISQSLVYNSQEVKKGEEIAKSGGEPGTPGAGSLSSGPHLHLEVRKDGKYIDPMKILPL